MVSVPNKVIYRALLRVMRENNIPDVFIEKVSGIDITGLRNTGGVAPEIMASDLYTALLASGVSVDDFSKYFPKKYAVR